MTIHDNAKGFFVVDGVCLGGVGGKMAKQLKTAIVSLKTADTSLSNTCHTGPLTFDD